MPAIEGSPMLLVQVLAEVVDSAVFGQRLPILLLIGRSLAR